MVGLSRELRDLRVALLFFILVDSGQKTGIKGEFRPLRRATRFHLDGLKGRVP